MQIKTGNEKAECFRKRNQSKKRRRIPAKVCPLGKEKSDSVMRMESGRSLAKSGLHAI